MPSSVLIRLRNLSQPILLGGGFALLVVMAVGAVLLNRQSMIDSAWVAHTLDVQRQLQRLLVSVRRSESAQRGLLLTGDAGHLEDFRDNVVGIRPALEALARLTTDNADQQARVARLRKAVNRKLGEMNDSVALHEQGRTADAVALVRDAGRRHMNEIRDVADDMSAEETRLLAERQQDSVRTNVFLLSITIAGAVLIVVLATLSILLIRRTNRERDAARRDLETTNVNLEASVKERTAELSEANEEIQRFAYIVSHDLRSPLVNIMGFTAELEAQRRELFDELTRLRGEAAETGDRDAALAAEFDEAIAFIKSSTEKMDRLIGAVLKLSREGRRQFRPEPIDMTALVGDIVSTVSHQAAVAGAHIEVEPLPPLVSDRLAVEQALSNLIDNAIKYLKPGTPGVIRVDGRANATQVLYNVRDNGRGIDPRDQQRVFELFRRAGTQDRPGEGIGLAHVRTLVRRLGGTLTLQSKPGEGSTFTVILPKQLAFHQERTAA
jgi:signal transduction histidine kinase